MSYDELLDMRFLSLPQGVYGRHCSMAPFTGQASDAGSALKKRR